MPSSGTGQGLPISPTERTCAIDLTSAEDLYLLYTKYFFPPEIDEAGFRLAYGIYDPALLETKGMTFDLQSRIAMRRSLRHAHQRLAHALGYYPLPTQITDENQSYVAGRTTGLRFGWMTTMGDLSCAEVQLNAAIEDDGDMFYTEVTLPADGSVLLDGLYAYEPGTRSVRVPIAWREMANDTDARLYFYPATLVESAVWRACGALKTPCDCAAVNGSDLMTEIDIYGASNDADGGVHINHVSCSTVTASTSCAEIVNARAGWIIPETCACMCAATRANRAAYSYVSGRWTIDTIPSDVIEAISAIAATTLPEYALCMDHSMPQHLKNYRDLVPDLRGVPRQYGLTVAANAVMAYKQAKGI